MIPALLTSLFLSALDVGRSAFSFLPLAQELPDESSHVWKFIALLAIALVVIASVVAAAKYLWGTPDPTSITFDPPLPVSVETTQRVRYATFDELEKLSGDVAKLREESTQQNTDIRTALDEKFQHLMREKSATDARLHDKVEATGDGLRHEIDTKINEVRLQINGLPAVLFQMLRDAVAISRRDS